MKRRAKPIPAGIRGPGPVAHDVLHSLHTLGGAATVAAVAEDTGRTYHCVSAALQGLWRRRLVMRGAWRSLGYRHGTKARLWHVMKPRSRGASRLALGGAP
jgi:hypothetical protein